MKSFFRKISTDAVSFKGKNKKHNFEAQPDFNGKENGGSPSNGNNFWIKNCPNFHYGTTYNVNIQNTDVITTDGGIHASEKTAHESSPVIPKNVKENFSNISEASIEHFELVNSRINNIKALEKELGFTEDQFQYPLDAPQDEFIICQMLLSWKKAKTREATVGLLLKILWEAKEYDPAVFLSDNL